MRPRWVPAVRGGTGQWDPCLDYQIFGLTPSDEEWPRRSGFTTDGLSSRTKGFCDLRGEKFV